MFNLKEKISTIVEREVGDFKKSVRIADNIQFSQYDTIRRINCYLNDKFWLRQDDNAIFWNISNSRITHFSKNIDLDTKDLVPVGRGEANFLQAWILRIRFEKWMRDNKLSLVLNDLSEGLSTYGSIVWKLYDDVETKEKTLVEADLNNLYFNPTAKTIRKASVVELSYLTETEIRAKDGAWNNVADILKNAKKSDGAEKETEGNKYLKREIWERWGEVMDDQDVMHYMHYIGAGSGEKEVIAFEEEVKPEDSPYYDFHIGRYRGRWLRVGVVERLFKLQERANAVVNQNAEASQIASLLLLRTNDMNTTGNVLQGALNGQIVNSADLQQIGIDNRAFSILLGELDRIEAQADKICLTPWMITGDGSPAKIPFRSLSTLTNNAKGAFDYIKQTIGETLCLLLEEEVLPSVIKKWNRGDMIDISENLQDINLYDDQLILAKKLEYLQTKNAQGLVVTDEELLALEEEYRSNIEKSGRTIEITKGFFNFDYGITMNVTGENVDKAAKNGAYSQIIMWKTQNPQIVNDPYFRQYCEDNGVSPVRMSSKDVATQVQGLMAGKPATAKAGAPSGSPQDALSEALQTAR